LVACGGALAARHRCAPGYFVNDALIGLPFHTCADVRLPLPLFLPACNDKTHRIRLWLYDDLVQAFEVYYWRFDPWCVRGVGVGGVDVTLHCTWRASPWRTPITFPDSVIIIAETH